MNAKTYGQVLLDVMEKSGPFDRLSLVEDETFDEVARAVILEFIRRVEEKSAELALDPNYYDPPYTAFVATSEAFKQLSNEIKEAK